MWTPFTELESFTINAVLRFAKICNTFPISKKKILI